MKVEVYSAYCAGHRRPAMGAVHRHEGWLTLVRLEGRYGRVPALVLDDITLFDPRIVDMIGGAFVVSGLERTKDGAWVAQEWWVRVLA